MTRRWQIVRVELVGGRGERFDYPPGRVLILPPATTFDQLGSAIDNAFARWDLSHLRTFTLADDTRVCDEELADDLDSSPFGTIPRTMLLSAKVKASVATGEQFAYVFDLGDQWTHLCTVEGTGDPETVYGIVPNLPVPVWGWGTIPDQYGRRWADDTGDDDEAPEPRHPNPLTDPWLATTGPTPVVDMGAVCAATDGPALTDALTGVELDSALQQIGDHLLRTFAVTPSRQRGSLQSVMLSIHGRLMMRGWEGDEALAEELLAQLDGNHRPGRPVPVNLDDLDIALSDHSAEYPGGYLNTDTGEVVPAFMAHGGYVDEPIDVEDDAWLYVEPVSSRTGWEDMETFAESVSDPTLRDLLTRAIAGKGAFRRFKDVLHQDADDATRTRWRLEEQDRSLGRARALLASHGIRSVPRARPIIVG